MLCPKGPAGAHRQRAEAAGEVGEGHSPRGRLTRALLTCFVFSLVQVLGIKVETKVQCEAFNLNYSLLFPAVSLCLLLWVPLESRPVLRSQQRSSARGGPGEPRELPLLARASPARSSVLEPKNAKTHNRGKEKKAFLAGQEP